MRQDHNSLEKRHEELYRGHTALKSKQAADTMASIHLLGQIAASVQVVQGNVTSVQGAVTKVNKQIWGAIQGLRKQLGKSNLPDPKPKREKRKLKR